MEPSCIFCRIVSGDAPADIVFEDSQVVAFRDISPVAPTHILVIPRKHISNLSAASQEDKELLGHLMLVTAELARTEGLQRGYRLVTNSGALGGQCEYHLHLHLLGGRRMRWPPG